MLLQIGLPLNATNWIMVCVTSLNFLVLINGSPSKFFKSQRGLSQGCPLSPLLFLLVIEGMSQMICVVKRDGKLKGIKLSPRVIITHLLFMDDVVFLGRGTIEEWRIFAEIIQVFCSTTGMEVGMNKLSFLYSNIEAPILNQISQFLPYKLSDLAYWLQISRFLHKTKGLWIM